MCLTEAGEGSLKLSRQTPCFKSALTGVSCCLGAHRCLQLGRRQLLGAAMPGRVTMQNPAPLAQGKHLHTLSLSPSWGWGPNHPITHQGSRISRAGVARASHQPIWKPLLFLNVKVEIENLRQISDIL